MNTLARQLCVALFAAAASASFAAVADVPLQSVEISASPSAVMAAQKVAGAARLRDRLRDVQRPQHGRDLVR